MTKVNVSGIAIQIPLFERLASQFPRVVIWLTLIGCTHKYASYQNGSQCVRIPDYGTQLTSPAGTNSLLTDPWALTLCYVYLLGILLTYLLLSSVFNVPSKPWSNILVLKVFFLSHIQYEERSLWYPCENLIGFSVDVSE